MSYCINPNCSQPENHNDPLYCQACGSKLLIEGQYQVIKKLSQNNWGATYEVTGNGTIAILKVLHL